MVFGKNKDLGKTTTNLLDIINPEIKKSAFIRQPSREDSLFSMSMGTRLNLLNSEAPDVPIQYQNISKYHPLVIKLKLKTLLCKKSPKKKCSPKDLLSTEELDKLQRGGSIKKPAKKPIKKAAKKVVKKVAKK